MGRDSLSLARLCNGTPSYCPVGQQDSLNLARLRNGTVSSLPSWVTGYCGFGVVHPDSRLDNGAPRYVMGIPICNRTSWVSMRNRYMQLPLHAPPTLLKKHIFSSVVGVFSSMYLYVQVMRNIVSMLRGWKRLHYIRIPDNPSSRTGFIITSALTFDKLSNSGQSIINNYYYAL